MKSLLLDSNKFALRVHQQFAKVQFFQVLGYLSLYICRCTYATKLTTVVVEPDEHQSHMKASHTVYTVLSIKDLCYKITVMIIIVSWYQQQHASNIVTD